MKSPNPKHSKSTSLFKDKENTKEEDMTQADSDAERFADMNDFEEYRDVMMATIEDPEGYYKGKFSTEEIAQAIRDEAKSLVMLKSRW